MSAFNLRKMTWGVFVWSLLGIGICYASEAPQGKTDGVPSAPPVSTISRKDAGLSLEEFQEAESTSHGFMSGVTEQMRQILDEERFKTLLEIDKERRATLFYLTQERHAATEDVGEGISRIFEILLAERQATLNELEDMSYRITESVITDSKQLIDHFFIRLGQFTVALLLLAGIVAIFLFRAKGRGEVNFGAQT